MRVVADKQMPFALKVPNAETRAAMHEADEIARTRRARFGAASELFNDRNYSHGSAYSSPERAIWMATRGL